MNAQKQDPFRDPEILEVFESLLNMCVDRERQILKLNARIEELEDQEAPAKPELVIKELRRDDSARTENGILLVDESKYLQRKVGDYLEANGYIIIGSTSDGHQALQKFAEEAPALVIVDASLRSVEGYKFVSLIKQLDSGVKILAINPDDGKATILEAVRHGADECIAKPISPTRLLQIIDRLLDHPPREETYKATGS